MLIVLEEKHKQDLQFLAGQSPQGTVTHTLFMKNSKVIGEFVKISLDFLKKGPNTKLYNSAASKLFNRLNLNEQKRLE